MSRFLLIAGGFKREVLYNRYYEMFDGFRDACKTSRNSMPLPHDYERSSLKSSRLSVIRSRKLLSLEYRRVNNMNHTTKLLLYHCIAPLLLGGTIYLTMRPATLKMFHWVYRFGGNDVLSTIRYIISPSAELIPGFIIYNLPNAIWVYSYAFCVFLLWGKEPLSWSKCFWMVTIPMMAITPELLQKLKLLSGTFDLVDIGGNTCGMFLAGVIYHKRVLKYKGD